jgi:hypothetical protein
MAEDTVHGQLERTLRVREAQTPKTRNQDTNRIAQHRIDPNWIRGNTCRYTGWWKLHHWRSQKQCQWQDVWCLSKCSKWTCQENAIYIGNYGLLTNLSEIIIVNEHRPPRSIWRQIAAAFWTEKIQKERKRVTLLNNSWSTRILFDSYTCR